MTSLSGSVDQKSRKMLALVFSQFSDQKQSVIAAAIGVSDGTVSKFKSEHMETCCKLLAAAGLKIVPAHFECHKPEYMQWLIQGNKIAAKHVNTPRDMSDDDPE